MSLGTWFARKGNIGSTARWAADGFWAALHTGIVNLEDLDQTQESTLRALDSIVEFELGSRNIGAHYKCVIHEMLTAMTELDLSRYGTYTSQLSTFKEGECKSMLKLVLTVLKQEVDLHRNDIRAISSWIDIIEDELVKFHIGERFIYGTMHPVPGGARENIKSYLVKWSTRAPIEAPWSQKTEARWKE